MPHPSPLRTLLALSTLLLAIAIAVARHHVHIDPTDLSTLASLAHHRCGRLILLTLLWSTAELTLLFLPASPLLKPPHFR